MRVTTLVNKLIGLQGLWVRGFHFQADKARVVVDVVPRRRKPLCGICGRKVRKNKDRYNRYWRHLDLFGVRTYLLDPTSGMSAVWSGQRKGALGRQGKPLYQKLRTRGSVAGTEDGRQRRSELFPSDVAFGATDHPASGCRAAG